MPPSPAVERAVAVAHRAVYVSFMVSGFASGNWASRIPQIRTELGLTPAELGLVLLAFAVGSLLALPAAGVIVHRFGAARTISAMSLLSVLGLVLAAAGLQFGAGPVFAALMVVGFGFGTWDVAMNVDGAEVEHRLGRSVMSRYHAGWSVGTVAGALFGAAMNALAVAPAANLVVLAAIVAAVVPYSTRWLLPATGEEDGGGERPSLKEVWREPRTLLVGAFVLCAALIEGSAGDWLAIAAIDSHGASAAAGSLVYGGFVAAMTVGRWFGADVLDRFGRVRTLRGSAAAAVVGLALIIFGPSLVTVAVGTLLWGLGTALGFPTGMSAAADQRRYAAVRVSVVSTIGYVAFLAGPPLIGFVGNHFGVLRSLLVTLAFAVGMLLLAGVNRPLPEESA